MRFTAAFAILFVMTANSVQATELTITLAVEQMDCAMCKWTVQKALMKVDGVKSAEVSYEDKIAVVVFDDEITSINTLTEATKNAGYPSKEREGLRADD